jgi:glycosyltransferase involved in cell wall biosynthesis/tetratricopeptide (TPR) repeat protein
MQTSELVELKKSIHEESWKPAYKFLPDLIQKFNLKVGAEIGVAFGGHSEAILSNTNLELLYGIDSYQHSDSYDDPMNLPQADFDILCETTKNRLAVFGDRFRLIRSYSQQAIGQIDGLLDFVYIDAEHSYQGVWQDLCTWYSKIRVGGLISGHDYGHIAFPGVKQAIDEFFRRLDWQVHLEGDGVWWVEKQPTNISFFIPAYNCEQTLEESVDSILNGNFAQGDELIIVNDCSTDNTGGILERLKIKCPFIKIFSHQTNKGGGAARNTAVQNATHPLLFCLDSDNILVPGSIQKLKNFLLYSGADAASFQEIHFFQSQKEIVSGKWVFKDRITFADCLSKYDVPGSSGNYIFTKDSWIRAGGYPEFTGSLDTTGFGIRQLATGSKMLTLPGAYYLHRQGHESYWIRDSRTRNISVSMGEILASILHLIDEKEVEYIYGDGKSTWFSELEKRPICIRNIGDNLPYEETLIRQLCFDTKSLDLQEKHPLTNEAWESFRKIVRELILTENPRNFLNWDVINATMFYEPNIIEVELKYLQLLPDWLQWKEAIKESPVGNPKPYFAYPESSGNLIHHAYHLAQLMRWTGCALTEATQIVEFGGGYGSMCRLAHQLGFKGQYVIFDIPEFSNLQEYFLKSIGLSTVVVKNQVTEIDRHISLHWDIDKLSQQLSNATSNMTFVATWSISEAPVSVREQVFNLVADAKFYLIAYQEDFEGVNNLEYFAQFAQNKPNYQWYGWAIEHLPGNHYLIGVHTPVEAAKNPVITLSSLGMDNVARLGNNIFQYAFLKIYALENNLKVETPAWMGQYLFGHHDAPISQPLPLVGEQAQPYKLSESAILNAPEPLKNVDFQGYFQFHTQYHAQHKEYFQSLFKPVPEVAAKVIEALDILRSKGKTVVGLHLRRGDYKSVHTVVPYLTVAPSGWYKEWLDGFWETLDQPVLFIASDEIEDVIGDFAEYHPITVKDLGVDIPEAPFYPDFYILSQCDVLAISNSTFSFAAAMLNERCKFFFRPNLRKQKMIAFDPWNSEPLLRDNPHHLPAVVSQKPIKFLNIQEVALISPEDPGLLWGFSIDSPTLGTQLTPSNIWIGGWILGKKSPAVKVQLIRDDEVIREIPVNHHRPDVAAVFPGVPLAENSGYGTEWEITGTFPECEISIQAVLADETCVKIGVVQWKETISHALSHNDRAKCELSVCAIMKDEAPYLIEWLEFHKIVGVERFYLYNNNSTDNTIDILQPYLKSGEVILHDWPVTPGQIPAYEHCLSAYKIESDWIAFIDLDEFLFPTEKEDLKEVLKEFDGVVGVGVNQLFFGSSGHEVRPEGLQIEHFTKRAADNFDSNKYVKSIVRTEQVLRPSCPHFFIPISKDTFSVTENREPLSSSIAQKTSVQKLRINHYYTKSQEEMKLKLIRGWACGVENPRTWLHWEYHDRNEVEDLTIQRFIPKLRQAVDSVISQSRIAQILTQYWHLQSKLYQMQIKLEESQRKLNLNSEDFEPLTARSQQIKEELQQVKEEQECLQIHYRKTQEELDKTQSQLREIQAQRQEMESAAILLNQLAELHLAQGKLDEALITCEQLLKIQPKFAPGRKTLGNVFHAQGKLDEAKSWYIRALEIQPDFAEALANLGTVYAKQQEWQESIASYQKAIAIKPNFAGVYRNLAKVFSQQGKPEDAADCWYAALILEPEKATAEEYLNLGNTLLEQQKCDRAIVCYRRAVYLNPSFDAAYCKLGDVLAKQGLADEATVAYDRADQLKSSN